LKGWKSGEVFGAGRLAGRGEAAGLSRRAPTLPKVAVFADGLTMKNGIFCKVIHNDFARKPDLGFKMFYERSL
jgi:hypothetical protein